MEKYARQAFANGIRRVEDICVDEDSELCQVLNNHYNRNKQVNVSKANSIKYIHAFVLITMNVELG